METKHSPACGFGWERLIDALFMRNRRKEIPMLYTIIIVLIVLFLIGYLR